MSNASKATRVLHVFGELFEGEVLKKQDLADRYQVTPKSIQRDLDEIRTFAESLDMTLSYDRIQKGYRLDRGSTALNPVELLAVSKVLLESRGFIKEELDCIIAKLLGRIPKADRPPLEHILANERFLYCPTSNKTSCLKRLWDLSHAMKEQVEVELIYKKPQGSTVNRTVQPLGLFFAEYYFYLVATITSVATPYPDPAVFRLDRIESYTVTKRNFRVPYKDRFQEGEFRKRIQFMQAGALLHVELKVASHSLEAMLDRLPTAWVKSQKNGFSVLKAEVYGKGILMWLLSQGDSVEVLAPTSFREEMKATIDRMARLYV